MSQQSALGAMQDFPLRIMRLMDHAEREHGNRQIVAARADGTTIRSNWIELADKALYASKSEGKNRVTIVPSSRNTSAETAQVS